MTRINGANERVKRSYFIFLREARGRDESSIDAIAKSIARFEETTNWKDFRKFHIEQARSFKSHLVGSVNVRTGKPLAAATIKSTLSALRAFFEWLSREPGYKGKIKFNDAAYFTPPENLARVATARREKIGPGLDQIKAVLEAMPAETILQRRDRALVAFTIVTGARDGAIVTFKLKHVDIGRRLLRQDAREVRTKFGKSFDTWFFPVGDDVIEIFADWVRELRGAGFSDDDPVFPKTETAPGPNQMFVASGLTRAHWSNAAPVREIFKTAFAAAGQPYSNPHSFRHALMQLAYHLELSPEQLKAWSQNLGHEDVLTTFTSYGPVPGFRQAEIMRELGGERQQAQITLNRRELDQIINAALQGRPRRQRT